MFEYIYTVQNTILLGMVNQHYAFAYIMDDDNYHYIKNTIWIGNIFLLWRL